MGKRSTFEKRPRDYWPTPEDAVKPLAPHLGFRTKFIEPCAGNRQLVDTLENMGHICTYAADIEPKAPGILAENALENIPKVYAGDYMITNPPWSRDFLHPFIEKWLGVRTNDGEDIPFWLLFDADWMHTKQSSELIRYCRAIVSVGRVKWVPDSTMTGKDNCAWYLFRGGTKGRPVFYGRT